MLVRDGVGEARLGDDKALVPCDNSVFDIARYRLFTRSAAFESSVCAPHRQFYGHKRVFSACSRGQSKFCFCHVCLYQCKNVILKRSTFFSADFEF